MRTSIQFPEMIRKSVKRRVSAEMKRLAILLRRLIFLMALRVELAPLVPRPASNYFEKAEGEPTPRRPFFSVLPTQPSEAPDFLHGPIMVPMRGPVPAGPLIDRWIAMLATIKYAGYRANRLARTIQRWKAAGRSAALYCAHSEDLRHAPRPRPRFRRADGAADRGAERLADLRHELSLTDITWDFCRSAGACPGGRAGRVITQD